MGLVFIAQGLLFIPCAGIQNDEALFAVPLYFDTPESDHITLFGQQVPLMVMTYVGTLKSGFYELWFHRWRPGAWSVRVPVLIAGGSTVFIFFYLLRRVAGNKIALAGCALLATDPVFLLTTIYDWGPVALQHLLITGGTLAVLAFAQEQTRWRLGLGFFLFGLAMWDKAVAVWALSALGIAALAIFPREVFARFTIRNVTLAVAAFLVGALPLVIYNVRNPLATFQGNARFSTENFAGKSHLVRLTLEGSSLFGYIMREPADQRALAPRTSLERASATVGLWTGERRRSLGFWSALTALLLAPLWWPKRRPVLFALVFCAVAWLQMALTRDAGGGVHHTILLWPFPLFAGGAALGAASERIRKGGLLLGAAVAVLCVSNLLVTNQYFLQLFRNGTTVIWTDAITPLSGALDRYRARHIFAMDWGIREVTYMLHRGQLTLWSGEDAVTPAIRADQLARMLALDSVYVTHVAGAEIAPGTAERLRQGAAQLGYRAVLLETIADRNGRPIFQISEFQPAR